jgi:hypothetical protein
MQRILVFTILAVAFALHAAAPPQGDARLRELVVFPEINFTFNLRIECQNDAWVITGQNPDLPGTIAEQREQLKRQPEDVKRLMRLAYLLDSDGQTNESRSCYRKATQLCRAKIAAQPQDGFALTTLGAVLDALNDAGAENAFRKATLVSSNDWRCWVGLGNFLAQEWFNPMFPTNLWKDLVPLQVPSPALLAYRPSAEALKRAESACAEASRCYDCASAIALTEPEVFLQRAGFLFSSNWQACFFRHYRNNEEIPAKEWRLAFFSPACAASLQKASRLAPKDYAMTTMAAYFTYFNALQQSSPEKSDLSSLPSLSSLPAASRELIHESMTRLENLSYDPDPKIAAGACEHLGFLDLTFGNNRATQENLRRAVALDPARDEAWDMLMATLLDSASPDELLSVCKSRLQAKDSVRNRILLGKIYAQKAGNWNEAAKQAEASCKLETNNVVPRLLLAAIALKQSAQTNYLSIADANLHTANDLLEKMPGSEEKVKRWREVTLDTAILFALENNLEFAKNWANAVLKNFPNDETAAEILKALN